jgi:radical SAM superfamily enzyme YgiQ (UPF0313 family)
MLRRIRLRPTEDVIAELLHLHDTYGITGCMFLDDELNVNKQMIPLMKGLEAAAKSRSIEWRLRGFLKSELFTLPQAEAMFAAGFRQLLIGFESGSDRILTNIEKNATRDENSRAVSIAHAAGLKVKALMSLGHAGETEQTIEETKQWLLETKPDDFDATVITPYPGSPYYDRAKEIGKGVWEYKAKNNDSLLMEEVDFTTSAMFYKGAPGSYISHVWTENVSRERLVTLRDNLESDVRDSLKIPFYPTGSALRYEASMGQTIPSTILRRSNA